MKSETPDWRDHPLVQLTLVRYREFFREPEAAFWVFVFPVLLTTGLRIAFRNQAPERTPVAVVEHGAASQAVLEALAMSPDILASTFAKPTASHARQRRIPLRHRAARGRTARLLVDDALQRAAGRSDPVRVTDREVREPGSR